MFHGLMHHRSCWLKMLLILLASINLGCKQRGDVTKSESKEVVGNGGVSVLHVFIYEFKSPAIKTWYITVEGESFQRDNAACIYKAEIGLDSTLVGNPPAIMAEARPTTEHAIDEREFWENGNVTLGGFIWNNILRFRSGYADVFTALTKESADYTWDYADSILKGRPGTREQNMQYKVSYSTLSEVLKLSRNYEVAKAEKCPLQHPHVAAAGLPQTPAAKKPKAPSLNTNTRTGEQCLYSCRDGAWKSLHGCSGSTRCITGRDVSSCLESEEGQDLYGECQ